MKHIMRRAVLVVVCVAAPALVQGQPLDAGGHRHANPSDIMAVTPGPDSTKRVPPHRDFGAAPDSHVPSRSPDLGSPSFPLAPSIGPGSGLLGPEAGRSPARLRSNGGQEREGGEIGRGGQ